jgi:hypothetical protein
MALFYHEDFTMASASNFAAHKASATALFENPAGISDTTIRNVKSSPKRRLIRTDR